VNELYKDNYKLLKKEIKEDYIQEGAGNTLELIGIGKNFLSTIPAAQQVRERMGKWDFIKLKSFCTTKEIFSKLRRPPTE
jgi:hypothetical protein